jgi:hypothetical protein
MRLFLVDPELIEGNETIAEAVLSSELLITTGWILPRGVIDHLRKVNGGLTNDAPRVLVSAYLRTIACVTGNPIFVADYDAETSTYLGLFIGQGVRLWHEELDLESFRREVIEAVLAREAVMAEERLRSALGVLVREYEYEDIDDVRTTLRYSQERWHLDDDAQ